jgi:hypothetical protein
MAQPSRQKARSGARAPCLYTLRIELQPDEIHPVIWRKLEVDGRVSLGKLHHFIQAAFGWTDAHLHEFEIRGRTFAIPDREDRMYEREIEDERKAFLHRLLAAGEAFVYRYDFGDRWEHLVIVEKVDHDLENDPHGGAWVTGGTRACPPEDVGGAGGYQEFLETVLTDPYSEEGQRLLQWAGGTFDPELFDRRSANAAIQRMMWNRWDGK